MKVYYIKANDVWWDYLYNELKQDWSFPLNSIEFSYYLSRDRAEETLKSLRSKEEKDAGVELPYISETEIELEDFLAQIKWGRKAVVLRLAELAASTALSARTLVSA